MIVSSARIRLPAVLAISGGARAAASTALVVKDYSGAVGAYFDSIRLPGTYAIFTSFHYDTRYVICAHSHTHNGASILAGAAFSGLPGLSPPESKVPTAEHILRITYNWAIFWSFLLSINTIVISTAAVTKNLNVECLSL